MAAQAAASRMGVSLNAFFFGTLAHQLHEYAGQARFAVLQSFYGRSLEELHAVCSFSSFHPMLFDLSDAPGLASLCKHVMRETQRVMALEVILPSRQPCTLAWELNDLRPLKRSPEEKRRALPYVLVDLFFMVNQYTDGFDVYVAYNAGKYEAAPLEAFIERWMATWEKA